MRRKQSLRQSRNSLPFMQPEGSQGPITGPYPDLGRNESIQSLLCMTLKSNFVHFVTADNKTGEV
jgi:hypothetical protein